MEKKFNLLYEPWILVVDHAGERKKISVLDLFKRAHEYKWFAGELATQDVAIFRLLLAVVYAAFIKVDEEGTIIEPDTRAGLLRLWKELWKRGSFSYEQIEQYLKDYEERFFLFHPDTPFFQVADLRTADGKTNTLAQIIADVPSRAVRRFFSNRFGDSVDQLDYDEAARWLVHFQAWDYAGKKASVVGGAPNGGGTGWLGKLGVIYLKGENIFETLLLNLVLFHEDAKIPLGRPFWEKPINTAAKKEILPSGYADLLTWQSRRTRLFEEKGFVTGVISSYGDVFEKENTFSEQMTGWHISSDSASRDKYIPNTFNSERRIWRDLNSLLPLDSQDSNVRRAGVIAWRGFLQAGDAIDVEAVNIATIGAEYGAMMANINELVVDQITFNVNLLTDLGTAWIPRITDTLQCTETCIRALGSLARDLAVSSGADGRDAKLMADTAKNAKEVAYYFFDLPFRGWLSSVSPLNDDKDERCDQWKVYMRDQILRMGAELVSSCGERAFVGQSSNINASRGFLMFKGKLYKEVPNHNQEGEKHG